MDWISVKDGFPEKFESVLITDGTDCCVGFLTETRTWYSDGALFTIGYDGDPSVDNITHWMPLPEPPKE